MAEHISKTSFLPMAGEKEGWTKLAKNLKAEIDEELLNHIKEQSLYLSNLGI